MSYLDSKCDWCKDPVKGKACISGLLYFHEECQAQFAGEIADTLSVRRERERFIKLVERGLLHPR